MATLKFELTLVQGMSIDYLRFDNYTPIQENNVLITGNVCKNKEPITVYPVSDKLHVEIEITGNAGFEWQINIWMNGNKITDDPIKKTVNSAGRADYSDDLNW